MNDFIWECIVEDYFSFASLKTVQDVTCNTFEAEYKATG